MASLFLTGASGFIGRFVLNFVARRGHNVVVLRRTPPSADRSAAESATTTVPGDLLDPSSYADALHGIDTVVHLAAATGNAARDVHHRVNAEATAQLLDASARAGVRRFLFVSSIAVCFADAPHYHYAASKRAAERAVRESGLRYTILRPTIVLGPDSPIGRRFRSLAQLPVIPIFGDGRVRMQPVDVRDVAALIGAVIASDWFENDTVEVGGPDELTLEDLLSRLHRKLRDRPPRTIHLPLGPIRSALGLLERMSAALVPVTAGQLASFANDSIARRHPFVQQHAASLTRVDTMLSELAADG
jgi:nucleoside-diphosphate-sugar epimerase